jgi:hypothetical protein
MEPAKKRIGEIIRILRREYPRSRTALEFKTPLQILVATILAAQCTDERVNQITPALFRKYPTAAALAGADRQELEAEIRPTGFFRNKAKSIIGAARKIVGEFGGEVRRRHSRQTTLRAARAEPAARPREDRARSVEARPQKGLAGFQLHAGQPRPEGLPGSKTTVPGLPGQKPLSLGSQTLSGAQGHTLNARSRDREAGVSGCFPGYDFRSLYLIFFRPVSSAKPPFCPWCPGRSGG